VNILFVLRSPLFVRYYERVIASLAERGHRVHLGFTPLEKPDGAVHLELVRSLARRRPQLTWGTLPARNDMWTLLAELLRRSRDYLRYLFPPYRRASYLRKRTAQTLGRPLAALLHLVPAASGEAGLKQADLFLQAVEKAIPADPAIRGLLHSFSPDVVCVSPLIDLGSKQLDYLKAAQELGVPTILLVASWDNLTNKGRIQIEPDTVVVWNEEQRREAVELHQVPARKVVITGAQCFDEWFERRPSRDAQTFCKQVGLPPDRPFLLYLCSSSAIAPREADFVPRWLEAVRNGSSGDGLRDIGVLVRPHPQHAAQWSGIDLGRHGGAVLWPRGGAFVVDEPARADFFDSLYHCAAVVGVNTSGLIEAAIVGKPCHTVCLPEFQQGQAGTLHFAHLRQGEIVRAAYSLEEHLAQLRETLAADAGRGAEVRREFLARFVRPNGLDKACTPQLVEVIESHGSRGRRPVRRRSVAAVLGRWSLAPLARLAWIADGLRHRLRGGGRSAANFPAGSDPFPQFLQLGLKPRAPAASIATSRHGWWRGSR